MPSEHDVLQLLHRIRTRNGQASLHQLAQQSGWSQFHLHRDFHRIVRETPKQYTLRLRLERAAAMLVCTDRSVLDIALAAGFSSHEVFTRAFRRHFGETPARYRATAFADTPADARARHAALLDAIGPCVSLYHIPINHSFRRSAVPTLSIARQELAAQPVLLVSFRIPRNEIAKAIAEGLGKAFPYSQTAGLAIAGRPFTRYLSTGPGLFAIEVGVPVATSGTGSGDVVAGSLPGGPVAVAMHGGHYDQLTDTYAALERWIESNGFRTAGAPWESYITDPADHPDPADWRTEVFWPLKE